MYFARYLLFHRGSEACEISGAFFSVESIPLDSDTNSLLRTIVRSPLHKLEDFFGGCSADIVDFFQCFQYLVFPHENRVVLVTRKDVRIENYHPSSFSFVLLV